MSTKRLNLADFKLKKETNENEMSKLMGLALADCHDHHETEWEHTYTSGGGNTVLVSWDPKK